MATHRRALLIALLPFAALIDASCAIYQGPRSDHFDGTRFTTGEPTATLTDHVRWLWEMEPVAWPDWVVDPPQPPPIARTAAGELRFTYINHATTLIQIDGINILTDPIWSRRAGPSGRLGARRVRAPGLAFDQLPPIDVVLISHDHYDHLDRPTLHRLVARHRPLIIAGLGVGARLADVAPGAVVELDWWQQHVLVNDGPEIVFLPTRHDSGRGWFDRNCTLWGGFALKSSRGWVLFLGDTGWSRHFPAIAARFAPVRLAILPIGSYEKRRFMQDRHLNPDDAVRAHLLFRAAQSVGMHFGTFREHPEQTIDAHAADLAQALDQRRVNRDQFWVPGFGAGRNIP